MLFYKKFIIGFFKQLLFFNYFFFFYLYYLGNDKFTNQAQQYNEHLPRSIWIVANCAAKFKQKLSKSVNKLKEDQAKYGEIKALTVDEKKYKNLCSRKETYGDITQGFTDDFIYEVFLFFFFFLLLKIDYFYLFVFFFYYFILF
jgi:hypothetical protein